MTEASAQTTPASEQQWHAEQRRRWLLKQMGITPLVSRFDPPGARPAERSLEPESVRAQAKSAPHAGSVPATQGEARNSAKARAPVPKVDVGSTASRPARQPARSTPLSQPQPQPTAEPGVSFSLLICAAAEFLWIEQLPERVVAREQLTLTTAMAKAVGGHSAELVYRQFDWPIVDNPALPRDLATAQQSVGALLGRMRKEQAGRGIILMGDCPMLPEVASQVHRIPASLAMLENPALKAEAWAVLKPLVISA